MQEKHRRSEKSSSNPDWGDPIKFFATAIFESQLHPECTQVEGMAYSRVFLICQWGLESKDKYKYLQIDVELINDCFDLW